MSSRHESNSSFSNHGYNGSAASHEDVQDLKPEQIEAGLSHDPPMGVLYVVERANPEFLGDNVVAVCPGCGNIVERWPDGLPRRLIKFSPVCSECDAPMRREWAVIAPLGQIPSEGEARELVTSWWDKLVWSGPSRRSQFFRNWEFCDYFARYAEKLGFEWTARCPITEESVEGGDLEFDHDDYASNSGICCTREAHQYVHNATDEYNLEGQGGPADQQDWKAQKLGLKDMLDLKYPRRVRLHLDSIDSDVLEERFVEAGGKWLYLADRLQLFVHEDWPLEDRAAVAREQFEAYHDLEDAATLKLIEKNG